MYSVNLTEPYFAMNCESHLSSSCMLSSQDQKIQAYLVGSIGVSGKTKWDVLDGVIRRLFKVKVFNYSPLNQFTSITIGWILLYLPIFFLISVINKQTCHKFQVVEAALEVEVVLNEYCALKLQLSHGKTFYWVF